MIEVTKRMLMTVCITNAFINLIGQWLLGLLVGKLISGGILDGETSMTDSSYYNAILLSELSFHQTAVLTIIAIVINTLLDAFMDYLTTFRAARTGRKMRREILKEGIADSSDLAFKASKLIIDVKTIEDFQSNWEQTLYFNRARLIICTLVTFLFSWFGGLIAVVMLVASNLFRTFFDRCRSKVCTEIDINCEAVQNRFLDVLRNAVKIRIMSTIGKELDELEILQNGIEPQRRKNSILCFGRDALSLLSTALIPPLLAVVAWPILHNMDPSEALKSGTAIIVTILILEEAHKSTIYLSLLQDRVTEVQKAEASINEFLARDICCDEKSQCKSADIDKTASTVSDREEMYVDDARYVSATPEADNSNITNGISMENLMLSYPGRQKPVLSEYNKYFCRGKVHALQGESGCGKSTTMKVVADLIQPDSGTVRLWDNAKVAYVSQDQTLFTRTVRDNVTYGSSSPKTDEEIWKALELAHIHRLVQALPNGLDTIIAPKEVSGGQLQRLNLAHLFCVGEDADLVLLDECLSAVDEATRNLLIQHLGTFLKDKTAIIITHHFEFLSICDEVHHMNESDEIIHV